MKGMCFLKGTKILTNKGWICVEDLEVGHKVRTLRNGYKTITLVGSNLLPKSESLHKYPESDLVITGRHRILLDSIYMTEMVGRIVLIEGKVPMMAKKDPTAIPFLHNGDQMVYGFVLDSSHEDLNYGVWANGKLVESSLFYWVESMDRIEPRSREEMTHVMRNNWSVWA